MSENSENVELKDKRKSRKRKTVLKNARKYAKKNKFGRGTSISEDNYRYTVNCLEKFREGFPNEEEKTIFANNVLQQTENEELTFSCNQIGSRAVEAFLPFVEFDIIKRYIDVFGSDLRGLSNDIFASHVLQALVEVCTKRSFTETNEEIKNEYKTFVLKVAKFLLNNLEDYISDKYANNVIRSVLNSLSNFKDVDPKNVQENDNVEIPEDYIEIIKEYGNRLMLWPQFKDFPYDEITSGLLQVLLKTLNIVDLKLLKKIQKKLLDESYAVKSDEGAELYDVFTSKAAVNCLEVSILVAKSKIYTQIYARCFVGNLSKLATCKISNFAVQKLINCCEEKVEFEAIFDELGESFEEILKCRYSGVLLALAQTCKKLVAKQGNFIQNIMKALHCEKPEERQNKFITLTATLLPFEQLETSKNGHLFVNVHGSLLLQAMLQFNKPIKVVNAILNMDVDELKRVLFCDVKGSRVIDVYMTSQFIGEKSREKLIKKMQGTYQELATSKFGSRGLEALWKAAQMNLKIKIMDELSYKDGSWSNTEFGRIIFSKLNVAVYKRSKDEWKQTLGKTEKTKHLFADILEK